MGMNARPGSGWNAERPWRDARNRPEPQWETAARGHEKASLRLVLQTGSCNQRSEPGCSSTTATERRSARRHSVSDVPAYEAAPQGSSLEPCRPLPATGGGVSLFGSLRKSAVLNPSGPARAGIQPSSVLWCEALGSQTTVSVSPRRQQPSTVADARRANHLLLSCNDEANSDGLIPLIRLTSPAGRASTPATTVPPPLIGPPLRPTPGPAQGRGDSDPPDYARCFLPRPAPPPAIEAQK